MRRRNGEEPTLPKKYLDAAKSVLKAVEDDLVANPPPPLTSAETKRMLAEILGSRVKPLAKALFSAKFLEPSTEVVGGVEASPRDRLLTQLAFNLVKEAKPFAHVYASGQSYPSQGDVLMDVAFRDFAISDPSSLAKKVGTKKEYDEALAALKDEEVVTAKTAKRGGKVVTKVSFNVQGMPPADIIADVREAASRVSHSGTGARDEARKLLGEKPMPSPLVVVDGKGKRHTIPKTFALFQRSMEHSFDADADCAAYWKDEAARIGGARKLASYVKQVESSIAGLLTDRQFLADAARYGETRPMRKVDPFLVSIGAKAPTTGVPYTLIKGLDEGQDMDARKAFISPYLLHRGFYYAIGDHTSRRPYCVANASPLAAVFVDILDDYTDTGVPLAEDEVLERIKQAGKPSKRQPSAPAPAPAPAPEPRPTRAAPPSPAPSTEVVEAEVLPEYTQDDVFGVFMPTL